MRTLRYRLDVTATADGDQLLAPLLADVLAKFVTAGASNPGDQFTVEGEAGTQCTLTVVGYHQKWDFTDPTFFEEDGKSW